MHVVPFCWKRCNGETWICVAVIIVVTKVQGDGRFRR